MHDMPDTTQGAPARTGPVRSPQDFAAGLFLLAVAAFAVYASSDLSMGTLRNMGPGMLPRMVATLIGVCGLGLLVGAMLVDGPRLERWSLRGPFFVLGAVLVFAVTIRATTLDVFWSRVLIAVAAGFGGWWLAGRLLPAILPLQRGTMAALAGFAVAAAALLILREGVAWTPQLKMPIGGLLVAGPLVVLISGFADPEIRWKELVIFAVVMTALCIGLFRYTLGLPIPVLILPDGSQI